MHITSKEQTIVYLFIGPDFVTELQDKMRKKVNSDLLPGDDLTMVTIENPNVRLIFCLDQADPDVIKERRKRDEQR